MVFRIYTLTKALALSWHKPCLSMDAETQGVRWGSDEFLLDLPAKWHYSRIAFLTESELAGFAVATLKHGGVHLHRLVVAASQRRRGLGGSLVTSVALAAAANGLSQMTLKVRFDNHTAYALYRRLGFQEQRSTHGNRHLVASVARIIEVSGSNSPIALDDPAPTITTPSD